jgi:hypothetical protein
MTVKIILKYNDGTDQGRQVVTTEVWEGNTIPLAKIIKAMQSVRSEYNEKLVRTKLIKEIQTGDRK